MRDERESGREEQLAHLEFTDHVVQHREGRPTIDHLVENAPERPNVRRTTELTSPKQEISQDKVKTAPA